MKAVQTFIDLRRSSAFETRLLRTPAPAASAPVEPWRVAVIRHRIWSAVGETARAKEEAARAKSAAPSPWPSEVEAMSGAQTFEAHRLGQTLTPQLALAASYGEDLSFVEEHQLADQAARALPHSASAALRRASVLLKLNRNVEARDEAQRARQLAPWAVATWLLEASARDHLRECEQARRAFEAAMTLKESPTQAEQAAQAKTTLSHCGRAP